MTAPTVKPSEEQKPPALIPKTETTTSPSKSSTTATSPKSTVEARSGSQASSTASARPSVPAPVPSPTRQTTSPNPALMPGTGNRVGGDGRGVRQTTPDAEEVRRRRLAFLEKMNK